MLIAFAGLPSAGKSTTAKALADQLSVRAFIEPEEEMWPAAVKDRDRVGRFTALSWFRSIRVPGLYSAAEAAEVDGAAVIDSYYDVLLSQYIGSEPFAWLLDEKDPYFDIARRMAELDWRDLPKADVLVMLRLNKDVWEAFMDRRARDFDRDAGLKEQFAMQALIASACRQAEVEHGTRLLVIEQEDSSPARTAERIASKLGTP